MTELRIFGVTGIPDVQAGDNVAALIAQSGVDLAHGDVVVVTSKVVSKAEGRLVDVERDKAIDAETVRVVAVRGTTRIVETVHGFVMAAAGVDASNVPAGTVALLPVDPDASARQIREGLRELRGVDVAVIVTDTMGRPWRNGLVDVCIGAAGIAVLDDLRGRADAAGHVLDATVTAVADELAAAAELVKGKLAGVPVAVVRGWLGSEMAGPDDSDRSHVGARPLVRSAVDDLFRLGTSEAKRAAVFERRDVRSFDDRPVDPDAIDRALVAAGTAADPRGDTQDPACRFAVVAGPAQELSLTLGVDSPPVLIVPMLPDGEASSLRIAAAGAAVENLLIALAADGLGAVWIDLAATAEGLVQDRVELGVGWRPLGVIATGHPRLS